jgi:hypothetical protein
VGFLFLTDPARLDALLARFFAAVNDTWRGDGERGRGRDGAAAATETALADGGEVVAVARRESGRE